MCHHTGIVIWMPATPVPKVLAVGCNGGSCQGKNPQTMGCGNDAQTGPTRSVGHGVAQNRYSNACNAEWERTVNTYVVSRQYAAGNIKSGSTFQLNLTVSSPWTIGYLENVYTPMKGPQADTKSCGFVWDTGPISVPLPDTTFYCTIVD